jgi:hypothetical protein
MSRQHKHSRIFSFKLGSIGILHGKWQMVTSRVENSAQVLSMFLALPESSRLGLQWPNALAHHIAVLITTIKSFIGQATGPQRERAWQTHKKLMAFVCPIIH